MQIDSAVSPALFHDIDATITLLGKVLSQVAEEYKETGIEPFKLVMNEIPSNLSLLHSPAVLLRFATITKRNARNKLQFDGKQMKLQRVM